MVHVYADVGRIDLKAFLYARNHLQTNSKEKEREDYRVRHNYSTLYSFHVKMLGEIMETVLLLL